MTGLGKGANFNSVIKAVRKLAGEERYAEMFAALPPPLAEFLRVPLSPGLWYPISHFKLFLKIAAEVAFRGDAEQFVQVGEIATGGDINALYRALVRVLDTSYAIRRAAPLWSLFNKNHGAVSAEPTGPLSCELLYSGIPDASPAYWCFQRGSLHAIAKLSGAKTAATEILNGGGTTASALIRAVWSFE